MKPFITIIAATLTAISLMFVNSSCSDDNNQPNAPAARQIAGTYCGDMTCTVMNNPSTFEDQEITVTATDDATVNIVVAPFGEAPMAMPEITVPGVKVSGTDGKYTLAATEFSGTTANGRNYSGTLQGSYTDNSLTVNFSLKYGAMPMPLICSMTASRK